MTETTTATSQVTESADAKKTRKAEAKSQREQEEQEIYNNFATPLIGTFLNLPKEPVVLKCPACGIIELSQVENEIKWWANEINQFLGCLFVTFCCCCCFDYSIPCKQTDQNHYCRNCGCYFGRVVKHASITPRKQKK